MVKFHFKIALELYGNNWVKVQEIVRTRTSAQIRSHAQKYKLKQMYLEAQEKLKTMKEDERVIFKAQKTRRKTRKTLSLKSQIFEIRKGG